ncbi:tetratricopeptide repeat protein [Solidesulfovibrio carbinoliphilus]|nr:tetratricopeptide repeat protein [Solidesulfovibrio carbinoliphilus]
MKPAILAALFLGLLLSGPPARAAMSLNDLLFYGTESLDRGRFEQAGQAFAEAVARDPENPYARGRLALALAASGQTQKAVAVLEAAVAARGDDLFALWTLGCLELLDARPAAAGARFAAMVRADPGNARGRLGLGLAALDQGHLAEGLGQLAAVQESESPDPLVRYLTGLAYWSLDAPANARLELEATLELEPRNTAALDLLGLVYRRLGQAGLAKSAWDQALAVSPDDAHARFFLSRLAEDEGLAASLADRPEEARRAYERALSIDPGNAAAAKVLGLPVPGNARELPPRPTGEAGRTLPPAKGKAAGPGKADATAGGKAADRPGARPGHKAATPAAPGSIAPGAAPSGSQAAPPAP